MTTSADVDRTVPSTPSTPGPSSPACSTETVAEGSDGSAVAAVIDRLADELDLTTVLYRVTRAGEVVASGARGDNRPGSPADTSLHFRIGNVAFGYMGTLLLHYVETGEASLDDPISKWLPDRDLPAADEVTLRMLVQNTSGYADYVRADAFVDQFLADPFAVWTPDRLIEIAMATAPFYPPGTAWSYAHTNYVLLGEALEAIGGDDLGALLTEHVIAPLGLTDTAPALTPDVPDPVMRSYSTERGVFEETTTWNPSWRPLPGPSSRARSATWPHLRPGSGRAHCSTRHPASCSRPRRRRCSRHLPHARPASSSPTAPGMGSASCRRTAGCSKDRRSRERAASPPTSPTTSSPSPSSPWPGRTRRPAQTRPAPSGARSASELTPEHLPTPPG